MTARVVRRVPLIYASGADAFTDRPAHVRASSGMAWIGERLAVVQDDANFVALVDTRSGQCEVVVLPAGHGGLRQFDDGRGNKRYKHDFEALVAVRNNPTLLIAFGSGSSSRREHILVIADASSSPSDVRVVPMLTNLYGARLPTNSIYLNPADVPPTSFANFEARVGSSMDVREVISHATAEWDP